MVCAFSEFGMMVIVKNVEEKGEETYGVDIVVGGGVF
jgi:hypothetical protein